MNDLQKVAIMRKMFSGRTDVYGRQYISADGKKRFAPVCKMLFQVGCNLKEKVKSGCSDCKIKAYVPVTDQTLLKHIKGEEAQIVYLLLPDNTVNFCAIDFDYKVGKEKEGYVFVDVAKVTSILREWCIAYILARSSGLGFHLYIPFSIPIKAKYARAFIFELFELAGFMEDSRLGRRPLPECFPKSSILPDGGLSIGIKPPMIEPNFSKGRNCLVDDNNIVIAPENQWEYLAGIQPNSTEGIESIIFERNIPFPEELAHPGNLQNRFSKVAHAPAMKIGMSNDVVEVARLCIVYKAIVGKIRDNLALGHRERFRLAQLGIALGLANEELIKFFQTQSNFDPIKTEKQIDSIRRISKWPACSSLASDFQLCDGACEPAKAARAKSPISLIDWLRRNDA